MRIAIDARAASHPQPGGFKTYTRNLIVHLAQIDRTNEYIIYLDRARNDEALPVQDNLIYRVLPNWVPWAGMVIREQVLLPLQLRQDMPDLVHFPCSTGAVVTPCQVVVTIHDALSHTEPTNWAGVELRQRAKRWTMHFYHWWSEQLVAREALAIITVSQSSCREIVSRLGVPFSKMKVIPEAVDTRFHPSHCGQSRIQLQNCFGLSEPFVLGIASASPRKNVVGLVEAYAHLDAALIRQFALVLVWTHGLLQNQITQIVQSYGLGRRVIFLQEVSDAELVALYCTAQVFVFPSLEEGFGLPPLEAMACGTPVVASNRSSIPEVVGEDALLVDPTQPSEIANAIRRILTEPELKAELRERGLQRAAQFSWERTARETLAVYENCVTGKRTK